jgi:hypothetical protein
MVDVNPPANSRWKSVIVVQTLPEQLPHPQWPSPIGQCLVNETRSTSRYLKIYNAITSRMNKGELLVVTYYHLVEGNIFGVTTWTWNHPTSGITLPSERLLIPEETIVDTSTY